MCFLSSKLFADKIDFLFAYRPFLGGLFPKAHLSSSVGGDAGGVGWHCCGTNGDGDGGSGGNGAVDGSASTGGNDGVRVVAGEATEGVGVGCCCDVRGCIGVGCCVEVVWW